MNNLGHYYDLYVRSDTLLLVAVFENFRSKYIEIYELDPAFFLSAPGLIWQEYLIETGKRLELLTYINILLMIEKGARGGICHAVDAHANNAHANNKYIKNCDGNNLCGYQCLKKYQLMILNEKKSTSKFNEDLIKSYDEEMDKGYIFEVDVEYPKDLHDLHSDLPVLPERMNINKCNKLVCNLYDKKTILFT